MRWFYAFETANFQSAHSYLKKRREREKKCFHCPQMVIMRSKTIYCMSIINSIISLCLLGLFGLIFMAIVRSGVCFFIGMLLVVFSRFLWHRVANRLEAGLHKPFTCTSMLLPPHSSLSAALLSKEAQILYSALHPNSLPHLYSQSL